MNPPLPVDLTRRPSPETALLQLALLAGALLLGGPLFVAGAVWSFQRLRLDPSARAVLLAAVLALGGALLWAACWPALRAAYGALFGGGTRRLTDLVTIWGLSACLIPIGGLLMAGSSELGRWLRPPTLDEQLRAQAAYDQALRMPLLYAVGLLVGVLTLFFDVAYGSYLPALVEPDRLVEGNSKLEATQATTEVLGPGLAGWLVQLLSGPVALLVDAASFFASAFFLGRIRAVELPPQPAEEGTSMRREIWEGLRFVGGHPILRALALVLVGNNAATAVILAVLILYTTRDLGLDPGLLGLAFAVSSVGSVLGAVLAERIGQRLGVGRSIIAGLATVTGGTALVSLAGGTQLAAAAVLAGGLLIAGIGQTLFIVTQVSLRQAVTPDRFRGRMTASLRVITWGGMPIASVFAGLLAEEIGLRATAAVSAALYALAVLTALVSPIRSLREMPPTEDVVAAT